MIKQQHFQIVMTLCLFALSSLASAKEKTLLLGLVDGESSEKMSVVTIRLSEKPNWKSKPKLEAHGTFMQIELPGSIAPEPGKFFDGNSPIVKKIVVLQINPQKSAVRMFLSEAASIVKEASEVAILDKRLVITTDHRAVYKASKQVAQKKPKPSNLKSSKEFHEENLIAEKTQDAQKLEDPALADKLEDRKNASLPAQATSLPKTGSFEIKDHIINIALFFGVMFAILIFSFLLKPIIRKSRVRFENGEEIVNMKLLSSLPVAAKQKLSLIQVGNEQVLIAISPDQVSLITKINEKSSSPSFQHNFQQPALRQKQTVAQVTAPNASQRKSLKASPQKSSHSKFSEQKSSLLTALSESQKKKNQEKITNSPTEESNRINVSISDEGIRQQKSPTKQSRQSTPKAQDTTKSIEDVTKLIREKLKNLPNID